MWGSLLILVYMVIFLVVLVGLGEIASITLVWVFPSVVSMQSFFDKVESNFSTICFIGLAAIILMAAIASNGKSGGDRGQWLVISTGLIMVIGFLAKTSVLALVFYEFFCQG